MTYEDIALILMRRDDMEFEDAMDLVNETQSLINFEIENNENPDVETIMSDMLGLEMDYIWAFLELSVP